MRYMIAVLIIACGGEDLDVPETYEDPEVVCGQIVGQLDAACRTAENHEWRDGNGDACECPELECQGAWAWTECDPFLVADCYWLLEYRLRTAAVLDACPREIPDACLIACR